MGSKAFGCEAHVPSKDFLLYGTHNGSPPYYIMNTVALDSKKETNIVEGNVLSFAERGYFDSEENDVATGPSGPVGGGGHIPFFGEMLKKAADKAKKQATGTTDAEEASEAYTPSAAAKGVPVTKDEKMLQAMKAELAKLDPDSEGFMEEATGKLIDSVIDQEYGESFKKNPGYENLQEKLVETVLNSEAYEDVEDFFKLLLLAEEVEYEAELDDEEQGEDDSQEDFEEEESYEEDQ